MEAGRGDNNINNCDQELINSSVDWRGRPSNPIKHGGMKAAAFVLGTTHYPFLYILITYHVFRLQIHLNSKLFTLSIVIYN